jgi:hypothetical protein
MRIRSNTPPTYAPQPAREDYPPQAYRLAQPPTHRPMREEARPPRRSSAFISGKHLDSSAPTVVRWSSILLIILSFLCTIVAFHGNDWQALRQPSAARIAAAVGLQAWCTGFEWYNRKRKFSPWYIQAFILDVIPSAYAFYGIVGFFFAVLAPQPAALWLSRLDLRVTNGYTAVVWLIAILAAVQLARIPEDRLITE